MKQKGGYINSHILKLSTKYNQTSEIKLTINNTITNTGHGSVFLGTAADYECDDKNIRMLVGAHFSDTTLKLGSFGGSCNKGEMTIDTVIRETIEEIFNFYPTSKMIEEIRDFLNNNTQLYFIFNMKETTNAYSYLFDISILADFIRIISTNGNYFIPSGESLQNINNYLDDSTIKLYKFLKERFISKRIISGKVGLDEIKYLSFPALQHLVDNADKGSYNVFIFGTNQRELLPMRDILIKLLKSDIIKEILNIK